jgi:hypothetical protein
MPRYAIRGMLSGCLAYAVDATGSLSLLMALMYLLSGVFVLGGILKLATEVLWLLSPENQR